MVICDFSPGQGMRHQVSKMFWAMLVLYKFVDPRKKGKDRLPESRISRWIPSYGVTADLYGPSNPASGFPHLAVSLGSTIISAGTLCRRSPSQHAAGVLIDVGEFDPKHIHGQHHIDCVPVQISEHQRGKTLLQRIRGSLKLR